MSVFESLAKEHALLLKLIDRLERATVPETSLLLTVLFKALDAHERLEHLVFDESPEPPTPAAYKALSKTEEQHRTLGDLRAEAEAVPAGSEEIRPLARRLASLLRRHFDEEERRLWPSFNAYAGRSTLHRLARQAAEQLAALEREVETYWAEIEPGRKGGR